MGLMEVDISMSVDERFIPGEIYKVRPDVKAVVHSPHFSTI
jgi:hypothetical protein